MHDEPCTCLTLSCPSCWPLMQLSDMLGFPATDMRCNPEPNPLFSQARRLGGMLVEFMLPSDASQSLTLALASNATLRQQLGSLADSFNYDCLQPSFTFSVLQRGEFSGLSCGDNVTVPAPVCTSVCGAALPAPFVHGDNMPEGSFAAMLPTDGPNIPEELRKWWGRLGSHWGGCIRACMHACMQY